MGFGVCSFLPPSNYIPGVWLRYSKLPLGVNENVKVCAVLCEGLVSYPDKIVEN